MKKNSKTRAVIKKISVGILTFFVVLQFLPFLIPVSKASENTGTVPLPFEESKIAKIGDISLHYRQWIPKDELRGKVLMVHGLGGSTFSWNQSAEALVREGYLVIAVDLPGFGYSDRTPGMDHSQKARSRLLWELAETIEIDLQKADKNTDAPWNLVGHSMGGGTIAAMAMEKPENVSSLVFVAGALFDNNPGAGNTLLSYPPFRRWMEVFLSYYAIHPDRIRGFLLSAYGRDPSESEVLGYLEPLAQPGTARALIDLVRTAQNEPAENLKEITVPILGIWGENDAWVPVEQAHKLKAEYLPAMQLEMIADSGHCPMETHPEEFNAIVIQFLKSLIP
jgi:pimeloyl-ACP methyl ester carboxylesterase